ncbi:uncharacterized protein LOC124649172 [Lolium rigidum]|uniref:uncharacterized protein LOC124649172 n=1 Tax=Lolium rigidum TaxID=89674 RepID=UPI001F5CECEF|nr:uncharacterized protein LOC124649172 [Lolium rigidum]XP_047044793.1 uncharacterized protein LOC124649172 [Lolium rigidum]
MASMTSSSEKGVPADPQVESGRNKTEIKKKKKVVVQVPDHDVKYVLAFKPRTMDDLKVPDILIRKDPELAAWWYQMLADTALFYESNNERMLEKQRDYRHQLRTKGMVTSELLVDDDEDDTTATFSGGRRRHRPGVMKKQDGQTRRLN